MIPTTLEASFSEAFPKVVTEPRVRVHMQCIQEKGKWFCEVRVFTGKRALMLAFNDESLAVATGNVTRRAAAEMEKDKTC